MLLDDIKSSETSSKWIHDKSTGLSFEEIRQYLNSTDAVNSTGLGGVTLAEMKMKFQKTSSGVESLKAELIAKRERQKAEELRNLKVKQQKMVR